ncbi:YybH family protein [Promicromonospora thailandica]|uniref:SnoaL-like domain-containing protein n=1 Tax=Promicromonospora thailandica TaxID=765201 RepID=A0A9X2GAB4_9MICO|nr:nuclear transport factor 2 family protein [Promicromonospora thailandica]MCP2265511.1 SnoaL-like domain-containing protein [Promicromonospora thailandica]
MTSSEHDTAIDEWIAATNSHDPAAYLAFFTQDAVLDDPSVGEVFEGHPGIGEYFRSYFIGYDTHTRLVGTEPRDGYIHVEVEFTGTFPERRIGGIFDVTLTPEHKIRHVRADLRR